MKDGVDKYFGDYYRDVANLWLERRGSHLTTGDMLFVNDLYHEGLTEEEAYYRMLSCLYMALH